MSAFEQLAKIVGEAEALGKLDHKYAEFMHAQLSQLLMSVFQDMALVNAELTVAQAEVKQLESDREAVQRYLGVTVDGKVVARDGALETFRSGVKAIVGAYPNQKIMAIKEVRSNQQLNSAWVDLGGFGPMGLKEAKDVVDAATTGLLLTPTGTTQL